MALTPTTTNTTNKINKKKKILQAKDIPAVAGHLRKLSKTKQRGENTEIKKRPIENNSTLYNV